MISFTVTLKEIVFIVLFYVVIVKRITDIFEVRSQCAAFERD
jgi:hypothetical protein